MNGKARILFVDDEKRVLNAMRGLFRREYELFLASSGADALNIASENDIDVIVADQRMPEMTGIEVLSRMRKQSPRTVRILLTGYADPSAIEGSINEGEVFRFLSKPCPPKLLRETLSLAIEAAETKPTPPVPRPMQTRPAVPTTAPPQAPAATPPATPAPSARPPAATPPPVADPAPAAPSPRVPTPTPIPVPTTTPPAVPTATPAPTPPTTPPPAPPAAEMPAPTAESTAEPAAPMMEASSLDETTPNPALDLSNPPIHEVTEVVMSGEDSSEFSQTSTFEAIVPGSRDVGVVIFTRDSDFAASVIRASSDEHNTVLATTLAKVAEFIHQQNIGVLVTDFTSNATILGKIVNALKQRMPELVTIVASNSRDSEDMINLINYGQVFRYVVKPIDSDKLCADINAAVVKHLHLLNNPDAKKRYFVGDAPQPDNADTAVTEFLQGFRRPAAKEPTTTTTTTPTLKRNE